MIYSLILILMIIAIIWNIYTKGKHKKTYLFLFFLFSISMILLAGLRDGIGYDFYGYETMYKRIKEVNNPFVELTVEPLYILMNTVASNFAQVILISACLGVGIKILVIKKYSSDIMISLLLYYTSVFIMFDMGVIRQGIAMGIGLISIKYIIKKRPIKFSLCILIGSLFHMSLLILAPLYFIGTKKITKRWVYIILVGLMFISVFRVDVILTKMLIMLLPHGLKERATFYIANYSDSNITISFIKRAVFLMFFTEYYSKKKVDFSRYKILFFNMYLLSLVAFVIFSAIPVLGGRGSMNLYIAQIFIIADIFKQVKRRDIKMFILGISVLMGIISMRGPINHGNMSGQPYTPYKSIFSK